MAAVTISTGLLLYGVHLLQRIGSPSERRNDDGTLFGIERTTSLVTAGIYRYIRHPIYSSLLSLAWGIFFKNPSWLGGVLALASSVFLVVTAKVEETECMRYFGAPYRAYMNQTKMFVPFLF